MIDQQLALENVYGQIVLQLIPRTSRMNIIQISPPKHLHFSFPHDLHRVLTVTNLTLQSVYIGVLKSHAYEIGISKQWFLMEAFQEVRIDLIINWNQEGNNMAMGKIRIYYWEVEEQQGEGQMQQLMFRDEKKIMFEDISISCEFDYKAVDSLNYRQIINSSTQAVSYQAINNQINEQYYLMSRVYPASAKSLKSNELKNQILNYLQHLAYVISIEALNFDQVFLMKVRSDKEDICEFITFTVEGQYLVYAMSKLVSYGKVLSVGTLINIDEEASPVKEIKIPESPKKINKKAEPVQNQSPEIGINDKKPIELSFKQDLSLKLAEKKKKDATKQTFVMRRQGPKERLKRRNKSQQQIIQNSSQEEDEQEQAITKYKLQSLIRLQAAEPKVKSKPSVIRRQIKINETNMQMNQKVLNVFIQTKFSLTHVYVILRDCIRVFIIEDPAFKKIIKFDPINEENVSMPCPIDIYKDELIFGNESYIFWVNLQMDASEWKYVQRKYIYAIAVIEELSLVALGGKNFSKFSYFGKETSRSNIKLYSCSSSDKHEHLFTYDIPGNNVGNVMNMAYVTTPPLGTKLLLVHTLNTENKSTFYFLRVKAFNKIQIYGEIQLDELGIISLLKFKYNKDTCRVVCMQSLGQTQIDTFKKLKIKCQYQKVQVSTEGFKYPLKRFISYHLGGGAKEGGREWMSLVSQNGKVFYIYDFQSSNLKTLQLGRGEIKQVFSVQNGRYLVICSETVVRIRQQELIDIQQ